MTEQEFEDMMDRGDLDDQYWIYVELHGAGEISLCEDSIFKAVESGRYYEGFKESMVK